MAHPNGARRIGPALLVAGLLFLAAGPARPAAAKVFDAETFTLANGLEVVVLPNHLAPVAFQILAYKIGAADGLPGKNGLPHFLEHLMFKATQKLAAGQFTREIDRRGGTDNAFTGQDYTAFHQEIAKADLPMIMEMEADRMTNLQLTDAVVLPERDVIVEERHERVENDPGAQLGEMLNASLYLNHPYGLPVLGWKHEMEGYTTADALDFYRSRYAPNNAVLVIAGDVTAAEVKTLAEKFYGPIPRRDVPPRQRLQEPEHYAASRVTLKSPFVEQPSMTRLYLASSYRRSADTIGSEAVASGTDPYALQVLSEIMGDASVGRLYRRLVVEQGIAESAGCFYDPAVYDLGTFGFWGSPREWIDIGRIEQAIDAEIALLLKDGVTQDELDRAKRRLTIDAVKARDSLGGAARLVATRIAAGSSLDEVQAWSDRIQAVTTEDVLQAARKTLIETRSATGTLLPANGVKPGGKAPGPAVPAGVTQ